MPTLEGVTKAYRELLKQLEALDEELDDEQTGNPARTVKSTYAAELRDIFLRVVGELVDTSDGSHG